MSRLIYEYHREYQNRDGSLHTISSLFTVADDSMITRPYPEDVEFMQDARFTEIIYETRGEDNMLLELVARAKLTAHDLACTGDYCPRPCIYRVRFRDYARPDRLPTGAPSEYLPWVRVTSHAEKED